VTKKAVPIDVFNPVAGRISLSGTEHDVLHLNGAEYRALSGGGMRDALDAYAIAARVVPSIDVYQLVAVQIGNILAVASGAVADVEEQFPNGSGASATSEIPAPPV
jgi:hypothetical protein